MRLMVGAVLQPEGLLGSRRTRLHMFRWLYAGWLIVLDFYGFLRYVQEDHLRRNSRYVAGNTTFLIHSSAPEIVGEWFAETFVMQQMLLLVLATPTLVAGAITDEKRRGTLQYLLTTGLEARHILLGKLLARVGQVGLAASAACSRSPYWPSASPWLSRCLPWQGWHCWRRCGAGRPATRCWPCICSSPWPD
jgi:hypothetical protein